MVLLRIIFTVFLLLLIVPFLSLYLVIFRIFSGRPVALARAESIGFKLRDLAISIID